MAIKPDQIYIYITICQQQMCIPTLDRAADYYCLACHAPDSLTEGIYLGSSWLKWCILGEIQPVPHLISDEEQKRESCTLVCTYNYLLGYPQHVYQACLIKVRLTERFLLIHFCSVVLCSPLYLCCYRHHQMRQDANYHRSDHCGIDNGHTV